MTARMLATIIAGPLEGLSGALVSTENRRSVVRVDDGEQSMLVELDEEMIRLQQDQSLETAPQTTRRRGVASSRKAHS